MPEILIVYEHKVRDYPSCVLLSEELKRRGYSVGICHLNFHYKWLYQMFAKPKIVIGSAASLHEIVPRYTFYDNMVDMRRGRAPFFLNLQMEQVFRDGNEQYGIILDSNYIDSIHYVCWGEKRKEQLIKYGIKEDKIVVSGATHLDFLQDYMDGYYLNKEEISKRYKLDEKKKWILYISGFLWASQSESTVLWQHEINKKEGEEIDCERIINARNVCIQSRKITLDWVEKYLDENDIVFIYRPHPGEKENEAIKRLKHKFSEKFYVIREESVQQWIKVCETIDVWTSTAVTEIYSAKKACNIIQPIELDSMIVPIVLDGCSALRTFHEFKVSQSEREFNENQFPINHKKVQQYYAIEKQRVYPAYLKICDFVEKIMQKSIPEVGNGKFIKVLFCSKEYWKWRYMGFYAATHVRLSKIMLYKRKSFRALENAYNNSHVRFDLELTEEDKLLGRRIRSIVNRIAEIYK